MNDPAVPRGVRLLRQLSGIEPPAEAVQRAVERTRETLTSCPLAVRDDSSTAWRLRSTHVVRFGLAIAAIVLMAVGGFCLLFLMPSGTQNAFAQVQTALERMACVTFETEVLEAPKDVVAKPGIQVVDLPGNRYRYESADDSFIFVTDGNRSMHLDRVRKLAVILDSPSPHTMPSFAYFLNSLRDRDPDKVERLTDGELDGRTVERYRLSPDAPMSQGVKMTVSVDPDTHLPVRIETITDAIGGRLHVVCREFLFGQCDPSLFSMVAPRDYQVEKHISSEPQPAEPELVEVGQPKLSIAIHLAENMPAEGLIERVVPGDEPRKMYLRPQPIVTTEQIQDCQLSESGHAVQLTFTDEGTARMIQATSDDLPKQLVVIMDGKVVAAPKARATIGEKALITGVFPTDILQRLRATVPAR